MWIKNSNQTDFSLTRFITTPNSNRKKANEIFVEIIYRVTSFILPNIAKKNSINIILVRNTSIVQRMCECLVVVMTIVLILFVYTIPGRRKKSSNQIFQIYRNTMNECNCYVFKDNHCRNFLKLHFIMLE